MAMDDDDDDEKKGGLRGAVRIAVPVLIFAALAGGVYYMLNSTTGARREAPPLPTLQATLPPPPPPPKEKPPEPEKKVEEEKKIETPEPKQLNDAPKPLTINGPAQAGNDAFNLGAGSGGGDVASGFGNENYGRYLTGVLQDAIEQDDKLNHLAFTVQIAASVDSSNRIHVRIVKSSGDSQIDNDVLRAAQQVALNEEPPGAMEFRIAIHSKRPA